MRGNWSLCRRKNVFYVIKGFRVELIAFLYYFALGIFHLINSIGTYRVICYHTIGDNPYLDCSTGGAEHGKHQGTSDHFEHSPNSSAHSIVYGHNLTNFSGHGGGRHNDGSNQHGSIKSLNHSQTTNLSINQSIMDQAKLEHDRLEIRVQQAAVTWNLVFQLSHSIPALFADAMLGALGDRYGRQVNILIGLTGMMMSIYPMIIIFADKSAPLFILIIGNFISGLTGYMSIVMISSFAYLADTVVDPQMLTVRMTYFSVVMSVASIFSPLMGGALQKSLSYAQVGLLSQAILVSAFFLCLVIVKQRPPMVMRKIMLEKYIKRHGHPPPSGNEKFEKYRKDLEPAIEKKLPTKIDCSSKQKSNWRLADVKSVFKSIWQLWKEVYFTYTRKRPGHARLYLLFTCFVYFLNSAFENGVRSSVFTFYVQKSPFYWGPDELARYRSINGALHLAGSMIGIVILKKWFQLSDTTVILLAMGTHTIECVLYAFASSTATLYLGAATGCLAMMITPCIKSFIAQLVGADEVGKSFTAFGIATNVAYMSSNALYSGIYRVTVGWFAGFAFLLAGGLEVICMIALLWLHVDYHYGGFKNLLCWRSARKGTNEVEVAEQKPSITKDVVTESVMNDNL